MSDFLWAYGPSTSPVSSVHEILQARILEWVAMPSSRGSSQPRDWTRPPHCRWILYRLSHQGSPSILKWVAYPFSRGSSWPRNRTRVSHIAGIFFTSWAAREAGILFSFSMEITISGISLEKITKIKQHTHTHTIQTSLELTSQIIFQKKAQDTTRSSA